MFAQLYCNLSLRYILNGIMHLLFLFFIFLNTHSPFSQTEHPEKIEVAGYIFDKNGRPLSGSVILEKGTTNGTISDKDGQFRISVDSQSILSISFIGYQTQEIKVNHQRKFYITLHETSVLLNDVVVTALGLHKKESSLSYATDKISGEEINRVKDPNLITTLAGKIAGVTVNKSAVGIGGSAKVTLRGIRSVAGNNQPLYVIDGMPILNSNPEQPYTAIGGIADGGNRDGGDGISNLNPEDITSISILKGAPAAALYGTQAANGVILITTKKGEAGKQEVSFSSNLLFNQAMCLPRFQHSYGVSDGIESWGEKAPQPDYQNTGEFFKTGLTATHTLSVSTGKDQIQSYFSYANTASKGIIPGHHLSRHNLNLRETSTLYQGHLRLDGNINLMQQKIKNQPVPGGFYMNPLVGLYRFPIGVDMAPYRQDYEIPDALRNLMVQNWPSPIEDFEQNPYWVVNRILSDNLRYRIITTLSAKLLITDAWNVQARGTIDYVNDKFTERCYASTAPSLTGLNGRYIESTYQETQIYGDIIATYEQQLENFSLNISFGASINDNTINSLRYDSKTASLKYANVFTIANINMNTSAYINQQKEAHRQRQSLFATAQGGYRNQFFIEVSMRNDWASTLAFTSHEKTGFFYSSLGFSWILSKTIKMPEWINQGKIRGAWSKVGNDIPLYITNPVAHILAGGGLQWADAAPFDTMKPEINSSFEIGTEWHLFKDILDINFTFYNNHTKNQFFKLPSQNGDIYAYRYVNAGNIRNRGVELSLTGQWQSPRNFHWKTTLNYSLNRNKIIKLHQELPVFTYGPSGFSSSYAMKLKKGGSFGDIYGKAFKRDPQGKIVYETEGEKKGLPQSIGDGNTEKVGNANPRFNLSWNNTFRWKDISLFFLLDGRFGGHVLSQTQADLDLFGVTAATGKARDRGYVELEGQRITNVKGFYKSVVGGRAGVTEYYMYNATNVRLREMALAYTFPQKWLNKTKVFTMIQLSLIARNLCFLYKKAPFDPELVLSTGNDNQAIDSYGMPTTRNIGFNIRLNF